MALSSEMRARNFAGRNNYLQEQRVAKSCPLCKTCCFGISLGGGAIVVALLEIAEGALIFHGCYLFTAERCGKEYARIRILEDYPMCAALGVMWIITGIFLMAGALKQNACLVRFSIVTSLIGLVVGVGFLAAFWKKEYKVRPIVSEDGNNLMGIRWEQKQDGIKSVAGGILMVLFCFNYAFTWFSFNYNNAIRLNQIAQSDFEAAHQEEDTKKTDKDLLAENQSFVRGSHGPKFQDTVV